MADVRISELDPGGAITGAEMLEAVQSGSNVRLTHGQLSSTPLNAQTAINYTLLLTDQGKMVERDNANSNTVTVPPNSAAAFPIGSVVLLRQLGAGATSVIGGAGVTVTRKASVTSTISEQYGEAVLHKRATNTWILTGELTVV